MQLTFWRRQRARGKLRNPADPPHVISRRAGGERLAISSGVIVRRTMSYFSFALTAVAFWLAVTGSGGNLLAMFIAGHAGLIALIALAMLVAAPPKLGGARMLEAQLAFGLSTAVLLFCNLA
jgi:hypothetical protein